MTKNEYYKGFFVADEQDLDEEQLSSLLKRCKAFSKIVNKKGKVHILKRGLTDTEKSQLFFITRFLGGKLAKLEPELGIDSDIENIQTQELADFLSVDNSNARARLSQLVKTDFIKRLSKGTYVVYAYRVEEFLDQLEKGKQKDTPKRDPTTKTRKTGSKKQEIKTINVKDVINRLSANLKIPESKIENYIFIEETGKFKFNYLFGGTSKISKQEKCVLCSAYVLNIGFGERTFASRKIKDICFNSNLDVSGLNYAIRSLKGKKYLSKSGKHSQDNILLEEGKKEAVKIFKELYS